MSKLSFRARALDATKPLPIYHAEDLPDLSDYSTINRTVPQMPTGMEKEEETERHLQDVIQAKQTNNVKKKHVYIPTPEAAIPVSHYEGMSASINRGHQYVRVPGLGLEEVPDYDLDSEDEEWLNAQTNERPLSPTHFEFMMDKLEKGSGNTVLSEREAQGLLRDDENLVLAVYDYWLAKRLRLGRALIPVVKHEGRDGGSGSNPYLAFRKRTEKMQTRKNRKNDETAYMQMLKLKRDLEKAVSLFEFVRDRESKKQDLAQVQVDIFKKRYVLEDWSGNLISSLSTKSARHGSSVADWEHRARLVKMDSSGDYDVNHIGRHDVLVSSGLKRKRKKKYYYADVHSEAPLTPSTPDKLPRDSTHDLSSDRLEDEEIEGVFSFKRKPHVRYHSCRDPLGVWPWSNGDNLPPNTKNTTTDTDMMIMDYSPYAVSNAASRERARTSTTKRKYRYSRTNLSGQFIGLSRRRVGRGGRVLWDRACVSDPQDSTDLLPQSVTGNPDEGTGDKTSGDGLPRSESMDLGVENEENDQKSYNFHPRSPSPTSGFEFHPLPLIEPTGQSNESTTSSKPPSVQSTPFSGISLAFRGIPLTTEFREDAKTFSTLPTSQFFLKSSSPHIEMDYEGPLLASDSSWGLHQVPGAKAPLDPRQNSYKRTTSEQSITSSNSPLQSPSTPINYPIGQSTNENSSTTQQVTTGNEQIAPKELSRSSLSVADSKTIVLSNVPISRPKHQLEKSQKLPSPSDKVTKDVPPIQPVAVKPQTPSISSATDLSLKAPGVSNNTPIGVSDDLDPTKTSSENDKMDDKTKSVQSNDSASRKPPATPSTPVAKAPVSSNPTSSIENRLAATGSTTKSEPKERLSNSPSISTPDNGVLGFDMATVKSPHRGVSHKKTKTVVATLNTATLITSQLGQHHVLKKKDPLSAVNISQNSISSRPNTPTTNDLLKSSGIVTSSISSVSSMNATKLAEIQSSLLSNPDKTNAMSVSEIGSGLSGFIDRRAVSTTSSTASNSTVALSSNSVTANNHVSQALSTVSSAVTRRSSTGTNGTNYQDIFHTATRRISESAERGLKQALAGMNHNSLIETANSLVQLSNSSEVT